MSDVLLTDKDIPFLIELLVEISHKWEELAIALRLSRSELEEIRHSSSNVLCLSNVLIQWIKQSSSSPTLATLVRALQGAIMGEGRLAHKLQETFPVPSLADELVQFVVKKEKIKRSTAHIMMIGFPGNGKSHLLDNLLRNPRKQNYTSTGVSDSVVVVDVEDKDVTSHTAALGMDSDWKKFETNESLIMQVRNYKTLAVRDAVNLDEKLQQSFHSDKTTTEILAQNVKSVLKQNQVTSFAQLKGTSSLYFRDTGGQVEFQEILTILIYGPSIFFFVMKTCVPLNQPLTVEYRRGEDVINSYKSSVTTKQAFIQTLASIDATTKPANITTHDSVVFIIGTHTDIFGDDEKARKEKICAIDKELLDIIQTHGFEHLVEYKDKSTKELIFPVDNTSSKDFDFQVIRSRINSKLQTKFFEIEYEVSYLLFCLELRKYKEDILERKECTKIAAKFQIEGEEAVTEMLLFLHHRIGIIRYYDVDGLRHLVIKEPQVLFNKLTELIVKTFPNNPELLPKMIQDLDRGIIEETTLISIMLTDCQMTTLEFLLLLRHLRMITSFNDEGKLKYFVPAVLNHLPEPTKKGKKSQVSPLMISFSCKYCPKGLFGTIVCHFMSQETATSNGNIFKFSLLKSGIFKDQVSWTVSAGTAPAKNTRFEILGILSLKMHSSHIEIFFCPDEKEHFKTLTPTCIAIREIIEISIDQSLEHLRYDQMKIKQVPCFECCCGEFHEVEFKKNKVTIQCNEQRIYVKENMSCWFDAENQANTSPGGGQNGSHGITTAVQTTLDPCDGTHSPPSKRPHRDISDGDSTAVGEPNTENQTNSSPGISQGGSHGMAATMQTTLDSMPSVSQLRLFKVGGKDIRISRVICKQWRLIGDILDFDDLGNRVSIIEDKFDDPEDRVVEVLKLWLRGESQAQAYQPASWRTLIKLLRACEHGTLAKELEDHFNLV